MTVHVPLGNLPLQNGGGGNYLPTHAIPSQVLTLEAICSRLLKHKVFFERFRSVVLDSLLGAFPLSGVFLTFFYRVGPPTADPLAPLYQTVE